MEMEDIIRLEREITDLKSTLEAKEKELSELKLAQLNCGNVESEDLTSDDIVKFSRQIILPQIGRVGQVKLKAARVLVVGVGGLGCPVLLYLVNAGVGYITMVDGDIVERSNLHRQTLHTDKSVGLSKVKSALNFFHRYRSYTKLEALFDRVTPANASKLVASHDIVVDATDNAGTRYLINDECVRHGRPLVSGSALGLEGQVTVYNAKVIRGEEVVRGPCYRCLFPSPPPADSTNSCSQAGVLGPIPGLIGLIQSIETIKLIVDWPGSSTLAGRMILLDASDLSLRTVKLRAAHDNCPACGKQPQTEFPYYTELCGDTCESLKLLDASSRLTPEQVNSEKDQLILLDVRSRGEFSMCHIAGSLNFPISSLTDSEEKIKQLIKDKANMQPHIRVCCICRRGNDSQLAVVNLRHVLPPGVQVFDMTGGLHSWAQSVDTDFPVY